MITSLLQCFMKAFSGENTTQPDYTESRKKPEMCFLNKSMPNSKKIFALSMITTVAELRRISH